MPITRRHFMALAGAAGAFGIGAYALRQPVRLGLIGAGIQGRNLAGKIAGNWWRPGLHGEIVALAEVDANHARLLQQTHCPKADLYSDYRRLLERDDLEGVLIATPDHWHAQMALEALDAGKAVYCEKPISLTIAEGQALVEGVRRTQGVFLGGTMQRSDARFRLACELVRAGRLGKLHTVTVTLPQRWRGDSAGPFVNSSPPPGLDWERWLGQAPLVPYCKERCHGTFRRWFEYSGGQMADWGAHHLDIVQWALNQDARGPESIEASADLPAVPNGFNTPIEFTAQLRYPNSVQVLIRTRPEDDQNGVRFEGDEGWLYVRRGHLEGSAYEGWKRQPLPASAPAIHPSPSSGGSMLANHLQHFYRCIRLGEAPISDVVSQHRSASVCHLANLAMRIGQRLQWNAEQESFVAHPEADHLRTRPRRGPYQLPAWASRTGETTDKS